MGVDEHRGVMRRIFDDVINGKQLELAVELFADDHVLHPESPDVGPGAAGMVRAFAGLHAQFPDVRVTVESMVAEGDLVAVRLTYRGTDVTTGEPTVWPEMVFTRFAGGKAAESWEILDSGRAPGLPPW